MSKLTSLIVAVLATLSICSTWSGSARASSVIAAGDYHSCALTAAGGVKCWGSNSYGVLGDNTSSSHATAMDVSGLTSGVTSIAAATSFTCALTTAGGVKCWGWNNQGELGDNTTTERHAPVDVSGLTSGATAVTVGGYHACALTTAGGVKCWGYNLSGQLGDGTTTERHTPVDVSGLTSGVTAIAAGDYHTCALTTAGGVKCWGQNGSGELGDGTTTERHTPVDVSGLSSGATAIATGYLHSCALTTAGGVKCWGDNGRGQLGDNTTTYRVTPVDVSGLTSGVTAIAVGDASFTCALTSAAGVKCWGKNDYGQLGDNTTTERHTPVDVSGLTSGVTAIAAGGYHACAKTAAGGVKCWGRNNYGELGDNTTTQRLTPVDVSGISSGGTAVPTAQASVLAAAELNTCALTAAGGVKCWGAADLGDNTTNSSTRPVDVAGLTSGVTSIAAGWSHACALNAAGGVKCWGRNSSGELGDNSTTERYTPVDVSGLSSGVASMALGTYHACALTTAGGVKCWGRNVEGQLGDGTNTERHTPVDVSGLTSGVAAITAGDVHTCALTTAGAMKCWGSNGDGKLGDGTYNSSTTPINVSGLGSGVTAISGGYSHTCALTAAGGVKCWGWGGSGRLGDNTAGSDRLTAVDVVGLSSGVSAISAGGYVTCALTTAGGAKCWGYNGDGELGDGTTTDRHTPVDVSGLTSGVAAISAGGYHTCAKTTAGGVKCWGRNDYGQLGDTTVTRRLTPVDVSGLGAGGGNLSFAVGWNLVGNSVEAPIAVTTTFNDPTQVRSVWKWVTSGSAPGVTYPAYAFYTPTHSDGGRAYAASNHFDFLTTINAGEGYWLNARAAFTASLPSGAAVQSSSFMPAAGATTGGAHALPRGWSLIASADSSTPAQFAAAIATTLSTPPAAGKVYTNLTTMWSWDAVQQRWYFWAPSLVNSGGLTSYITGKGYLDFATLPTTPTGALSPTTGFWVNVP